MLRTLFYLTDRHPKENYWHPFFLCFCFLIKLGPGKGGGVMVLNTLEVNLEFVWTLRLQFILWVLIKKIKTFQISQSLKNKFENLSKICQDVSFKLFSGLITIMSEMIPLAMHRISCSLAGFIIPFWLMNSSVFHWYRTYSYFDV